MLDSWICKQGARFAGCRKGRQNEQGPEMKCSVHLLGSLNLTLEVMTCLHGLLRKKERRWCLVQWETRTFQAGFLGSNSSSIIVEWQDLNQVITSPCERSFPQLLSCHMVTLSRVPSSKYRCSQADNVSSGNLL